MIIRKKAVRAIIVALATVAAAACGSGADETTSSGSNPAAPAADAPENTAAEGTATTEAGQMPSMEGGTSERATTWDNDATFSFVYSVDTTGWTPNTIASDNSAIYLYPIYDTLIHLNEDAVPEPLLAQSWELVEPNVLELVLIEDWTFHDGAPFNAEAVKSNIEYARDLDGGYNSAQLQTVESVEVIDEYTVRVTANGSASPLIGLLAGTAGMMMSPALLDDEAQRVTPTGGSGAYRLVDYAAGSRASYERVENYWDPDSARVSEFTVMISNDDNARLNFVLTGEADATFLRASMLEAAENADLDIKSRPSLSSYNININPAVLPELEDPRVRQALSQAIDREGIGSGLLNDLCEPSHALFPSWYWAGTEEVGGDYYPYDPDAARELLAEAGASDLSFSLHTVNSGVWPQIAEVLQANFAEVGVSVEVVQEEIGALASNYRVAKTTGMYLGETKGSTDPSVTIADYFLATGILNPAGAEYPELEALHDAALEGASPEERGPIYGDLMKAIAEQAGPPLTICHITTPFASHSGVQDMPVPANGTRWFRGVSIAES